MRVGIVTSRTAEPLVRETVSGVKDVEAMVVALPVPVISVLSTRAIASIIRSRPALAKALSSVDMVILPGTVSGDAGEVAKVVERPTYKGPKSLGELPATLAQVARGAQLDTVKSADEVLGSLMPSLSYEEAFRIGDRPVARRGPPLVIMSEIDPSVPPGKVAEAAARLSGDGADVVIVGADPSWRPEEVASRVREALRAGRPVLAEAPNEEFAERALEAGAEGVVMAAAMALRARDLLSGKVVVASSGDINELSEAEGRLSGSRLILDPIVEVPPLGMVRSLSRYLEASSRLRSPILFSAADVTEDVEADTLGVHALLSLIAVELRASAYLVVEETYKSYRSTAEAREALRLAETAWQLRSTERGMFSRLLVVKQDVRPPRAVQAAEAEEVGYVEPKVSADQYLVINADHERGRVVVTFFRDGAPQGTLAGRHALSVARAAVRRFGLDPEHAAYLGYELAKAEMSLKLGKTYVQDEPLLVVPWERNGNQGC